MFFSTLGYRNFTLRKLPREVVSSNCYSRMRRMATAKTARRAFAPVGQDASKSDDRKLKGIIFDMDGTLCEPQNYMFKEMRAAVQIPAEEDILDHIHALPQREQEAAFEKIRAIESEAMSKQVPQPGMVELMEYLDKHGLFKGICTRNFDAPVTHLLENHLPSHIEPFSQIITRDFRPPKPSPAGIIHIANRWGLVDSAQIPSTPASQRLLPIIMVGDSTDDIVAGYEAGALTVLLRSEGKEDLEQDWRTDVVISRLDDLVDLLDRGIISSRV